MTTALDFSAARLDGTPAELSDYRGRVLLIVNTASRCGFTPQLAGLEALHRRFAPRGLSVLGFPSNQFFQEPGGRVGETCLRNYGVSFPVFATVAVNGAAPHPLFRFLKAARPGLLGSRAIKWNFTKFLVDRDGAVVARFAPRTAPAALALPIERLL